MSVFEIVRASEIVLPLTHSVASDELAMAEPQPKVLNLQPHHVAALRRADQAGANLVRTLIELADVAWIAIVIDYLIAVCHVSSPKPCLDDTAGRLGSWVTLIEMEQVRLG